MYCKKYVVAYYFCSTTLVLVCAIGNVCRLHIYSLDSRKSPWITVSYIHIRNTDNSTGSGSAFFRDKAPFLCLFSLWQHRAYLGMQRDMQPSHLSRDIRSIYRSAFRFWTTSLCFLLELRRPYKFFVWPLLTYHSSLSPYPCAKSRTVKI